MKKISCYHPAFMLRTYSDNDGQSVTKFLGGLDRAVMKLSDLNLDSSMVYDAFKDRYKGLLSSNPVVRSYTKRGLPLEVLQIPCGKCIGCRLDYSRSWADRMTYHAFGKEDCSYFITLTYDDDHMDHLDHSDTYDLYALCYDDMTEFIKKLRNRFRDAQIDYYYSGEYGSLEFRPHFHLIVYNLIIPDLEFFKFNDNGDAIYTSDIIDKLWQKGFLSISKFHWRNAAYTASYVEKKLDGRKECEYTAVGLTPEKARMSRRPGIAYEYYQDHAEDIWKNGGLNVDRDVNAAGHLGIPRYFRKLAEKDSDHRAWFEDWHKRSLERSNVLSPLELDRSSFDLDSIGKMLAFEEREVLSRRVHKKI